jgi:peptide/nickel transport system substrate-binding protein
LSSKVGVAVVIAASLALTACSSSKGSGGSSSTGKKSQATSTLNDISPMAYDQVPSGGTLRWPIDSYPPNFNINEIDGNDINISNIMLATLPTVWHFDAGSNPVLNTDVVDKAEQTSTSPQTIHYHINP